MLHNELYKIFKRMKKKGFREGLRNIRKQIYSTSKYYVVRHNLYTIPDLTSKLNNLQTIEISNPDCTLFNEMYNAWPLETRASDVNYVADVLRKRSENGAICLVIIYNDRLVGAVWLSKPNHYYKNLSITYLTDEYVIHWGYIIQSFRGNGIGKMLLSNLLKIARQKGISTVIGVVSSENTPSVRMLISVGFHIIGSFTEQSCWFKRRQLFIAVDEKKPI